MAFNPLFKGLIVLQTKNFRVEQDWEVPIPGFFVISSAKKAKSISDFKEEELIEFIKIVKKVREGMKKVLKIKNVYLIQSEESPHNFHFWIFPRYKWMSKEKFGKEINSVRPIMHYAIDNMADKKTISEVKKCVDKMRKFMER